MNHLIHELIEAEAKDKISPIELSIKPQEREEEAKNGNATKRVS